jgi:hypothetical protein
MRLSTMEMKHASLFILLIINTPHIDGFELLHRSVTGDLADGWMTACWLSSSLVFMLKKSKASLPLLHLVSSNAARIC